MHSLWLLATTEVPRHAAELSDAANRDTAKYEAMMPYFYLVSGAAFILLVVYLIIRSRNH